MRSGAHLYQYPLWNEPLQSIRLKREYVSYQCGGRPLGYAAILRIGAWPLRIGLVRCGPAGLDDQAPLTTEALAALREWLRRRGYAFVRFSHPEADVLDRLASAGRSERVDAFPFYPHHDHELIVKLEEDESSMLASFQKIARQEIRKAGQAEFEFTVSDDPDLLRQVWPVFDALTRRKGQPLYNRPVESYAELVRLARPHGVARIYVARLQGRAVQALLIVRDRDTAHYVAGALDVEALGKTASPACLLQWRSMRDFYQMGACRYDLGGRGWGALQVFKNKFHPTEEVNPPPLTLILKPALYRLWMGLLPKAQRYSVTLRDAAGTLSAALQRLRRRAAGNR